MNGQARIAEEISLSPEELQEILDELPQWLEELEQDI